MVFLDNSTETFEQISVRFDERKKGSLISEAASSQPGKKKFDEGLVSPATMEDASEMLKSHEFSEV